MELLVERAGPPEVIQIDDHFSSPSTVAQGIQPKVDEQTQAWVLVAEDEEPAIGGRPAGHRRQATHRRPANRSRSCSRWPIVKKCKQELEARCNHEK